MKTVVISVVRDWAMYGKCISGNPHMTGVERAALDNRERNEPVPTLYNRFLKGYDFSEPAWLVFCHEDFQPLEPLEPCLQDADVRSLWGPVGARTTWRWGNPRLTVCGRLEESDKAGNALRTYGRAVPLGTPVETFDCQCVIVHSSAVEEFRLRFDVRFAFDLYVEDFCVAASQAGVASRILPFACRHWSKGALGARYRVAERAFAEKWPKVCVTGTSSEILGGGASPYRRILLQAKKFKRRLWGE